MKTKFVFLLLGAISPGLVQAQVGSRGGGDVVVCLDPQGKVLKMESYDFWNASKKFTLTVPTSDIPYMAQVRLRFLNLAALDPMASEYYLNEMKRFAPDEIGKPDGQVALVPNLADDGDGKHVVLPQGTEPGCHRSEIRRMASFNPHPLPFEKPFLIRESLWAQAPEHVKAGIVQHELIYRVAKTVLKETDSVNSQFYNALISSDQFSSLTASKYRDILFQLDWAKGKFYSIAYEGESFESDTFDKLEFRDYVVAPALGGFITKPSNYLINGQKLDSPSQLHFYNNGKVAYFKNRGRSDILVNLPGTQGQTLVESCLFAESGVLLACNLKGRQQVTIENQQLTLRDFVSFHTNGDLKKAYLDHCTSDLRFFNYRGKTVRLKRGNEYLIRYDPTQGVLSAEQFGHCGKLQTEF